MSNFYVSILKNKKFNLADEKQAGQYWLDLKKKKYWLIC